MGNITYEIRLYSNGKTMIKGKFSSELIIQHGPLSSYVFVFLYKKFKII